MLSVAMFEDMNRSEQESLYRTSRTLSLVPPAPKVRHHSHGNIQPINSSGGVRIFGDRNTSYSDDLVLSVLKSPVNHVTPPDKEDEQCGPSPASEDELMANAPEDDTKFKPAGSEDELTENEPSERVPFLQRLRGHRTPRFGEAHHKRVPTPLKRKQRFSRNKSHDIITPDDVVDEEVGDEPTEDAPRGIPDPYYPIYLPIDQAFKAKYVFHHKKGKTFQERLYVFLEHPGGWICFVYHFTVKTTTGQKINNVINGLPNNVSHLSLKSEVYEDSNTRPANSNIEEISERNELGAEKAPQVPVHNLPSKSGFHDKEDKDEQLTLLNKSPSSLPSIPLKAVPALGAIPKILQNLPSTSKSSPKKLKNESFSISGSYSHLYYEPDQKTKLKSFLEDSSFKSIPVHHSSSSSIDSSSMLPKTPEPFLISSEVIKDTKNSLIQLNNFLTQLKGERDYSIPEINTHIEIAAIDENVKLNKLASRKFFSLNPRKVGIIDESPCKNMSQESLIAFYDLDTIDSDEDEDNN